MIFSHKKENILFSLLTLYFITLYFAQLNAINVIIMVLLCFYGLSYNTWQEKWVLLKQRNYISAMLVFFLVIVVSTMLSDNTDRGWRYVNTRLPIFFFPVSLGLISLRKAFYDKTLLIFASITSVIAVTCLSYSTYLFFKLHRTDVFFNDYLVTLLKHQSVYVALMVNIAIYIFAYFIFYTKSTYKPLWIVGVVFLFCFSYLLASRIMLVLLLVFSIGFCFTYIIHRKKYLEGITLLLGLTIGTSLIIRFFPQTLNRYKELSYHNFNYENRGTESHFNVTPDGKQWNGANFRLAAWTCGWELFRENPVMGVHLGDKRDKLNDKYKTKKFYFAIETKKNVHSNYLDVLYSMGIIGFILFITSWLILPFLYAIRLQHGLALIILFTFACAWITEVYLDKSLGGKLTGFFIPFLLTSQVKQKRQP